MKIDNEPIASMVSQIISEKGIKQSHVAKIAGYSKATFNAMLNNRKIIRPSDVYKIAIALDATPNELFYGGLPTNPR